MLCLLPAQKRNRRKPGRKTRSRISHKNIETVEITTGNRNALNITKAESIQKDDANVQHNRAA
jgi:hypothetical protein